MKRNFEANAKENTSEGSNYRRRRLFIVAISALIFYLLAITGRHEWITDSSLKWPGNETVDILYGDFGENVTANIWSDIMEVLCPNNVPRVQEYANVLFELAGKEIQNNTTKTHYNGKNKKRIQQFFQGLYHKGTKLCQLPGTADFIMYMRIYKCGNNQIMEWMNSALNCYSKGDLIDSLTIWNNADVEETLKKSLCIITAIRDPISHFLSAYNEIEYQWLANHSNFEDPKVKQKLIKKGDLQYVQQMPGSKNRFERFVREFLDKPMGMSQGAFDHLDLMSRILPTLDQNGLSLTAYLPSLHNLTGAWPVFVSQTCTSDHHTTLRSMELNAQHDSSKDPFGTYQAAQDVWDDQGAIAKALCILHAMDYACFDLVDEVPLLCQEVYSRNDFQEALKR
jgi:hypothetical protein